ncbi:hypothetical protein MNBD_GAMMA11-3337 [hydrothermal vent metagenome]|uniref:Uncharacterized protein n=1 Tax=hydrothermal vent metagenome TaxID=652676 RepID=A0A3B0XWS9_9ZZZZ
MKWHSAMIKLTLKITGLLLIAAAPGTPTLAQSPWAVQKTVVDEAPADTATSNTDSTAESNIETLDSQDQPGGSPAAMEADNSFSTTEEIEQPEEIQTEVTEQRGDVLNTNLAPQDYTQQSDDQDLSSAVRLLGFPQRGMSTEKVKNELGSPSEVLPAVGQPPITRWIYNDRTIYFEYSAVIHVVAN